MDPSSINWGNFNGQLLANQPQPTAKPSPGFLGRLAHSVVSTPAYFLHNDIVAPALDTYAQLSGNHQLENEVAQYRANNIGATPGQALKRLAGNTAQLASFAVAPEADASLAAKAGVGAAQGALFSGGSSLANNDSAGNVLKSSLLGGATGGAVAGVLGKVLPGGTPEETEAAAEDATARLSGRKEALLQVNGMTQNNETRFGVQRVRNAAQNTIDLGAKGSVNQKIANYLQPEIDKLEGQIGDKLASSDATYAKGDLLNTLKTTFEKSPGSTADGEALAGAKTQYNIARQLVNNINDGDTLTAAELNEVKRQLGDFNQWRPSTQADTLGSRVNRDLYTALNDTLKADHGELGDLLSKTSQHIDSERMLLGAGGTRMMVRTPLSGILGGARIRSPALDTVGQRIEDALVRGINGVSLPGAGLVKGALASTPAQAIAHEAPLATAAGVTAGSGQPAPEQHDELSSNFASPLTALPGFQSPAPEPTFNGYTADQVSQAMNAALQNGDMKGYDNLTKIYNELVRQQKAANPAIPAAVKKSADDTRQAAAALDQLQQVFDSSKSTGKGLLSDIGALEIRGHGLPGFMGADLANQRAADALPVLAKALGIGTSKQDLATLRADLPKAGDNSATAKKKLDALRTRLQTALQNTVDAYKNDPTYQDLTTLTSQ